MTARARITQSEVERVTKAVKAAGIEYARISVDFAKEKVDIILLKSGTLHGSNPWDDE
jgi:hypothetical protein